MATHIVIAGAQPDRGNLLLSLQAKRSNPVIINLFASANAFLWIATPSAMARNDIQLAMTYKKTRVTSYQLPLVNAPRAYARPTSVLCSLTKTGQCPVFLHHTRWHSATHLWGGFFFWDFRHNRACCQQYARGTGGRLNCCFYNLGWVNNA